nr:TonB-dependent receptor [uncultured Pedobacter sp.]
MRKILWLLLLFSQSVMAQHAITAIVKNETTHQAIEGVSVYIKNSAIKESSNEEGKVTLKNIPFGNCILVFSDLNYQEKQINISYQMLNDTLNVFLHPKENQMEAVIVSSTRTNSRVEDNPIRVEVIRQEEITEEGAIKPMGIAKLLTESGSVLPQQTSSINGNVSIRLQGLDGRYTQVLKDGFPLYSGFSQGLSITQIAPLDLKQIEIIKGSSSSLYGSDAIAGIINLISKQPKEKPEFTLLLNATSLGGEDANLYFSKRWKKIGFSLLSANSLQKAKDINHDGFSELASTKTYHITPTFYYQPNQNTSLRFGINGTFDRRKGGDMLVLDYKPDAQHQFFEENLSHRLSSQFILEQHFSKNEVLTFKNSEAYFNRNIDQNTSLFGAQQWNTFTEGSFSLKTKRHQLVLGMNFNTEKFVEDSLKSHLRRDQQYQTLGVFVQDDWKMKKDLIAETGLRVDFQNKFGTLFLPRLALKYLVNPDFYVRAGTGLGYKLPTIFSTSSEEAGLSNIQPLSKNIKAEQSIGANIDLNYKIQLEYEAYITFNQSFFSTSIHQPLVLQSNRFTNASQPLISSGFESDLSFVDDEFKIITAYTFVNAKRKYDAIQPFVPLTPKHKLNMDVIYEVEGNFSVAAEGFYLSSMYRDADIKSSSFFTLGLSLQKYLSKKITLIGNLENILNVKQSNRETLVLPPTNDPVFRQIYAPIEGRVFNLALKMSL